MFSSHDDCQQAIDSFVFKRDVRRPPAGRRGSFKAGYRDASLRGRTYRPRTLRRLTWYNLGYRVGTARPEYDNAQIDAAFGWFASHYLAQGPQ